MPVIDLHSPKLKDFQFSNIGYRRASYADVLEAGMSKCFTSKGH